MATAPEKSRFVMYSSKTALGVDAASFPEDPEATGFFERCFMSIIVAMV